MAAFRFLKRPLARVRWNLRGTWSAAILRHEVCIERDDDGRPLLTGYGSSTPSPDDDVIRIAFGNLRRRCKTFWASAGWCMDKRRFVCQGRTANIAIVGYNEYGKHPDRFVVKGLKREVWFSKPRYKRWRPEFNNRAAFSLN